VSGRLCLRSRVINTQKGLRETMSRNSDLARRMFLPVLLLLAAVVLHGCSAAHNTVGSDVSLEPDAEQAVVVLSVRT
jgi:predicted small secreted protein